MEFTSTPSTQEQWWGLPGTMLVDSSRSATDVPMGTAGAGRGMAHSSTVSPLASRPERSSSTSFNDLVACS